MIMIIGGLSMENKGNDGKGNIPERDVWETKQELFNILDSQYHFGTDCCASEHNTKCDEYFDDFEKAVIVNYVAWMNPPFSKAKKMFTHFFKVVGKGVAIYRCDNMETTVWQNVILKNANWVFIPKGRIAYTPFETGNMRNGMGTRFPSALIGLGVPPPQNITGAILLTTKAIKSEG